jgi:hypothetical protein
MSASGAISRSVSSIFSPALTPEGSKGCTPLILIPGARAPGLRRYSWLRIEEVTAWFSDTNISREARVVASLNRPASNLTGVAGLANETAAKRLELLHKLVPATELIAMLGGNQADVASQAGRWLRR